MFSLFLLGIIILYRLCIEQFEVLFNMPFTDVFPYLHLFTMFNFALTLTQYLQYLFYTLYIYKDKLREF